MATETPVKTNVTLIGPVRLGYLNVYEPRKNDLNDKYEYSVRLMIPKQPTEKCPDPKGIAKTCADAIKAAAAAKLGDKITNYDNPLRDGDTETNSEGQPKEPGYWYINCRANEDFPPELINAKRELVTKEMGWKSGDWGKVAISFYGYDQKKKGVGCGLRCIQFLYTDEPLGGGGSVSHMFQEEQGDDPTSGGGSRGSSAADEYDPFEDE